jgi:hypothetical protein
VHQLCLHIGKYMTEEIESLTKTTSKKNKAKEIVLLNSAKEAAYSFVALANKTSGCNYPCLTMEEMLTNTKQQVAKQKKNDAKASSEDNNSSDPESE